MPAPSDSRVYRGKVRVVYTYVYIYMYVANGVGTCHGRGSTAVRLGFGMHTMSRNIVVTERRA